MIRSRDVTLRVASFVSVGAVDLGMTPQTEVHFPHVYRLTPDLVAGPDHGPAAVWHDPEGDLLAPGDTLHVVADGMSLHCRLVSRGTVMQDGEPIGFAAADPSGALLFFAVRAPVPDRPLTLATRNEGLFGVCPGTAIATPAGPRAVETLVPGALIETDAGPVPVLRVARRIACPLFADPLRCLPIRIEPGALGPGLPARALDVSPDLALLLGAALVQAGALVNGRTIRRMAAPSDVIVYCQLVLPVDALAWVQGVQAETRCVAPQADEADGALRRPPLDFPRAASRRQALLAAGTARGPLSSAGDSGSALDRTDGAVAYGGSLLTAVPPLKSNLGPNGGHSAQDRL